MKAKQSEEVVLIPKIFTPKKLNSNCITFQYNDIVKTYPKKGKTIEHQLYRLRVKLLKSKGELSKVEKEECYTPNQFSRKLQTGTNRVKKKLDTLIHSHYDEFGLYKNRWREYKRKILKEK